MTYPLDTSSADASVEDRVQLILDIPAERLAELESLSRALGASSLTEMFNTALSLAQWAVAERASGRVLASVDEGEGSYRELLLPRERT